MGLLPHSVAVIDAYIGLVGGYKGCRMVELGEQQLFGVPGLPDYSSAKPWFKDKGVEHTSVDINGQHDSLPLDLTVPNLKPEWDGQFDFLTDFGTSEHVDGNFVALYHARANAHRWVRVGGVLIFDNPLPGCWGAHGNHHFSVAHYERLLPLCGYKVLQLEAHYAVPTGTGAGGGGPDAGLALAVFQKTNHLFATIEEYTQLCQDTVTPL